MGSSRAWSLARVAMLVPISVAANSAGVGISDTSVSEGNAGSPALSFTVTRSGAADLPLVLTLQTTPGTATPGVDYTSLPPGTGLVIPAGQDQATIRVPVVPDSQPEGDETVLLSIASAYDIPGPRLGAPRFFKDALYSDDVRAADLDGDGRPDLVVRAVTSLSVLKNTTTLGLLQFDAPSPTNIAAPVWTIADIDLDGLPDIVVAAAVTGTAYAVTVYRNTTQGGTVSFASAGTFAVGNDVRAIAVADFDKDGLPDVITANRADDTVSVLQHGVVGGVLVMQRHDYATGDAPVALAVADFDGDGLPDVATANAGAATVSILRNTSTSSLGFAAHQDVAAGAGAAQLLAADLDQDGRADLAVTGGGARVGLLRNTGAGASGFAAVQDYALPSDGASLAAGDIDGDGRADLVVAESAGTHLYWLRNTGSAGAPAFSAAVEYLAGQAPSENKIGSFALADLDGDGSPDAAVADACSSYCDDGVVVLRGTGGALEAPVAVAMPAGVTSWDGALASDLDGDGRPDVVTADDDHGTVSVYRNAGASNGAPFAAPLSFATGGDAYQVVAGDLDRDGRADLVVLTSAGAAWLGNDSSPGAPAFTSPQAIAVPAEATALQLCDVDGDGWLDLITADYSSNKVSVLRNLGVVPAAFAAAVEFATAGEPLAVACGDLDGDGRLDLAVADYGGKAVSILRNTGGLSFAPSQDIDMGGYTPAVAIGDIDGDGRPDVVAVRNYTGIAVLSNRSVSGSIAFAARQDFPAMTRALTLSLGDVDLDGRVDVLLGEAATGLEVLRNATSGGALAFASQRHTTGTYPTAPVLADFNGDGLPDLFVASVDDARLMLGQGRAVPILQASAIGTILDDDTVAAPRTGGSQGAGSGGGTLDAGTLMVLAALWARRRKNPRRASTSALP